MQCSLPFICTIFRVYDPADYNHLQVSSELKDLFRHITRYTPQAIDLETQLRPFIPEYIPAIGDIDAFLKVDTVCVHAAKCFGTMLKQTGLVLLKWEDMCDYVHVSSYRI